MREELAKIDIDFNKMMALTEFLIYHYKLDDGAWVYLVGWVPSGSQEQMDLMARLQADMANAQEKLSLARAAVTGRVT